MTGRRSSWGARIVGALGTLPGMTALAVAMITVPATACHARAWRHWVDKHPVQIAPNAWQFAVDLRAVPYGRVFFVSSEYDFAAPTDGMVVAYDFSEGTSGYSDPRRVLAVAPTLFDQTDGFLNGWDISDMRDGVFSGVVYASAPLTEVHFLIQADRFVWPHRRR